MPSVERDVPPDPREPRTRGPLVPPGVGVRGAGERHRRPLREGRRGLRGVLGRPGPQPAGVEQGLHRGPRLEQGAVRHLVRRRRAQRRLQLRRPPRRGRPRRQGGDPLRRRARRRHPRHHLCGATPAGAEGRERPAGPRSRQGRHRRDLPPDDPRGRGGDAGLRADRGAALRGLRRLLGRGALHAHQRREVQARHHLRRRLPARIPGGAQAGRRRGPGQGRDDGRARARRPADGAGHRVERPRRLVARGARPGRRHP